MCVEQSSRVCISDFKVIFPVDTDSCCLVTTPLPNSVTHTFYVKILSTFSFYPIFPVLS